MHYEVMTELLNKLDNEKHLRTRDCVILLFLGFVLGGLCMWVVV